MLNWLSILTKQSIMQDTIRKQSRSNETETPVKITIRIAIVHL